ncbi:lactonase family protein with 7-bladed beta-propeller [Nitrosomonas sp. Nm84]|uniref:multicopper oxidase domain-containing protein n=1 Tax=Nitrosomonas sp. Nm84 TaxID=200124 RepID=UPI000D752711|nr:multicopper oxidase domain-containing protein [Nitrosomonas sp. Nm84]PXW91198.1 lactonase family protein with 7-bladed beta-propeller [Nitrosomonas sp. Nm84]
MNHKNISGITRPIITVIFFVIALLTSSFALAAVHNISLTAETLPNGQLAYAMAGNEAVIPGPALFVKEGDSINVTLTNNTSTQVGFKVPGLPLPSSAKVGPGKTKSYSVKASKAGTYVYHGNIDGKEQLGLFGALIVDKATGPLDRYVEANGNIVPVTQADLDKQFVLFMVGSTFWGTEISSDGTQKPLWANPNPGAVENDIVRFHILAIGPGHTFHLHAHRWFKTGTNEVIDTKLLADGSDTHSFTVKAGSGVGDGDWQYHCHLIAHMEAGMHGSFKVYPEGGDGASIVGASPYGNILLGDQSRGPGLVTFEVTDEPASWFRSARGDAIVKLSDPGATGSPLQGADIKTKSLEVIYPGSSVNFVMSETNGVHTISSLLWPSGAHHMPFNQTDAYRGGGIVKLDTPGLYVFTCKVHPFMFAAVIVDDPSTEGLDLGNPQSNYTIDLATGIKSLPTSSDLAVRLLKTFFITTATANWRDYSTGLWNVSYPTLPVRISGEPFGKIADGGVGFALPLSALNVKNEPLSVGNAPATRGVGEVWVNTQFEKTASKFKPGTSTVVDTATWTVKRKVALPQINNNNPHNMWTNRDQSIIFQTQWFDNKFSMINRETGELIKNIQVGYSPSHVVTLPTTDDITIAINGENGIYMIPAGTTKVEKMLPTQAQGHVSANPHGHWISADGSKIVTPNIGTHDVGVYAVDNGTIQARTPTGGTAPGAHPIAIGMMPDSSKIYATNLLHHSLSVLNGNTGALIKTVSLIADYNPLDGTFADNDGNGKLAVGVLPIQAPVSPDGKAVVIASMDGQIVIIDTATDTIVTSLDCDPGCHGANFGAKEGGGYYAYVTSKFGNRLAVVDVDPNGDGDLKDAVIAGHVSLVDGAGTAKDDTVTGLPGFGGQGVLAVPNVYNGWVQNLPAVWKEGLTPEQQNPKTHH